ncbi:MAG: DUF4388 domain-containing protein [Kofleriaceae bacterium]|nr:DUF4388 domain-containing protein [Kofleriaceae bacterium]
MQERGDERRAVVRLNVGARVAVWSGKSRQPGHLRNLSRYGAFVCCNPPPAIGAIVKLVLEHEGELRTLAMGLVAYQITEESSARLGTPAGVGVRFQRPLDAAIAAPPRPAPRASSRIPMSLQEPTRRMILPMLSELRVACRTEDAAPRFAGELAEVGVPYLLAMVERTQRTCRLQLTRGAEAATIDFAHGTIVSAHLAARALPTDDVVSLVMGWQEGTFAMAPTSAPASTVATKTIAEHLVEFERRRAVRPRVS